MFYMKNKENFIGEMFVKTTSGLGDIIDGIPVGSVLGIYGHSSSGKTILITQLASECACNGNSLIVDTEGSGHIYSHWVDVFSERYGEIGLIPCLMDYKKNTIVKLYPEDKKHNIYVLDIRDIEGLLSLLGKSSKIEISKNGKMTLKPIDKCWISRCEIEKTPFGKFMDENNINFMAFDSLTNPLSEFGSQQENFPARASAVQRMMLQIQFITHHFKIPIVCTHHETIEPMNPYSRPQVKGGASIMYNTKYMLYISRDRSKRTPSTMSRPDNVREVWVSRAPNKAPFIEYIEIALSNMGFSKFER